MSEITTCRQQYSANRCEPGLRVPAIEAACVTWEECMRRNPTQVSRAKLTAETFAEIINSFIEPISYKTMGAVVILGFGGIALSNVALWAARSRVYVYTHQHSANDNWQPRRASGYGEKPFGISEVIHPEEDNARSLIAASTIPFSR